MTATRPQAAVLVVAGTHGNERNAPWLLEQWQRQPSGLADGGLALRLVLGNPRAHACNRRYLERDLNRCFAPALLDDAGVSGPELERARELLDLHGPQGTEACAVALDLHSTTSAMGNSLVLYGRRPTDLALAAAIQARLGLPVYLHEADSEQSGFLVERWPCGLVIEVGPVPQGVIQAPICRQTQLALEAALAALAEARAGRLRLPAQLLVHRHLGSLDLPRAGDGSPLACIHPQLQHRDWHPLAPADPLFLERSGRVLTLGEVLPATPSGTVVPVFINEAAYGEKGIALSLTRRERWPVQERWPAALESLAAALAPAIT
ncbi:aspartoacylase [Cyanobium sp. ATX 6A2]|jgi:aspartoacylase|uniref:aspartoacylase n=1 Tax=Cyanobium sp. ATX 6A2 TaxID=2823700 RepID=UPI0020CB7A24|nr:aspartoacylase [Cyanobium sp. ATX 6A2]MCP9889343.1 aspartoacylase [Cyanobium sp. ATX 6A2]